MATAIPSTSSHRWEPSGVGQSKNSSTVITDGRLAGLMGWLLWCACRISLAHYGQRGAATAITPSPLRGGASLVFVRHLAPISLHHIKLAVQ
jgi:hypothetical protein